MEKVEDQETLKITEPIVGVSAWQALGLSEEQYMLSLVPIEIK